MKNLRYFLRLRMVGVVLLLLLSIPAISQAQAVPDSVDLLVQQAMRQLRIHGLQLAVVRHGRIEKLGNYGLANVQDSVPVTPHTRFFLNSITKAFVGVAVMQLVGAGKLDLAAPVGHPAHQSGVTGRGRRRARQPRPD